MPDSNTITVATASRTYPVQVVAGGAQRIAASMAEVGLQPRTTALVCDEAIASRAGISIADSLTAAGMAPHSIAIAADERLKTLHTLSELCARMSQAGIDRTSVLVAVGGGIVGDIAGFAAATFMRGIPCVQVPTTLLAMVDAAVGGKTAVNLVMADGSLAKNMVGAVTQPHLVICDPELLATLPARDLRSGLAECIKHAVIADPSMLAWIRTESRAMMAGDVGVLQTLVARNVKIKAAVVAEDEHERGVRRHLNLGHTFAHAIESLLSSECTHGEAVAIGLLAACRLSVELGLGNQAMEDEVLQTIVSVGLPSKLPTAVSAEQLFRAMNMDKKKQGGALHVVVPVQLGSIAVRGDLAAERILAAWRSVGAA